eukprot:CAMPEP_0168704008 /NCGR_PEP_ID=MMETSP0503-20121227/39355_1 /TAXON_ID=89963 /ORGANISM="Heterocapsa rotundata, Strain SCCAP K-0483" /LENGTH=137 /DNA_ID=CAMNT_0008750205 /DNA_START=8 /DNA_END=417 /DNA_ORIENTATION=+
MPIQQDARRLRTGQADLWGYDVISLFAIDKVYGSPADVLAFVAEAHRLGIAVIVDFVANHFMWGAAGAVGHHFFLPGNDTDWGPRPDFARPEVRAHASAADPWGALYLAELTSICRRHGKLCIAEDLEDGDGLLQWG